MPNGFGAHMLRLGLIFGWLAAGNVMLAQQESGKNSRRRLDELLQKVAEKTAARKQIAGFTATRGVTQDPGIATSGNFSVLANRTEDFLARRVLTRAEELRREIAERWLGEELPEGIEYTLITVDLNDRVDEGLTLLAGARRGMGGENRMWLTTSRELVVSSTLAHEVTHIVLATAFPKGMPAWANEGIASLADDERRAERRRQILKDMKKQNRLPALDSVLASRKIQPTDEADYAVSHSLVQFLLSRGDEQKLINFVRAGGQRGWNQALKKSYGIQGVAELQIQWESWLPISLTEPSVSE